MTKREFILKISEHENYLHALENRDVQAAMAISDEHMAHTLRDYRWIKEAFPHYIGSSEGEAGCAWYPLDSDCWNSLAVLRNPPGYAWYPYRTRGRPKESTRLRLVPLRTSSHSS